MLSAGSASKRATWSGPARRSAYDFAEFFARHVRGTLDPPLQEYFAYAGIEFIQGHALSTALPFQTRRSRGGLVVTRNSSRTPQPGARIVSLDGKAQVEPAAFLKDKSPGQKVKVAFEHNGTAAEVDVELIQRDAMFPTLRFMASPTELQKRIRESWLTGK